ncbi:hypothetical protein [Streptomyces daliensis]
MADTKNAIRTKHGFPVEIYRDGDEVLVVCRACTRTVDVEAVESEAEARDALEVLKPVARRHADSCPKG